MITHRIVAVYDREFVSLFCPRCGAHTLMGHQDNIEVLVRSWAELHQVPLPFPTPPERAEPGKGDDRSG